MTRTSLDVLVNAAILHDVGKAAIRDTILSKPGPLTTAERAFIHQHTLVGERVLMAAPALAPAARLVRSSHEWIDGSGYPDALKAEEIPMAARIIHACAGLKAMTSERPWRGAISRATALQELARFAGPPFDARWSRRWWPRSPSARTVAPEPTAWPSAEAHAPRHGRRRAGGAPVSTARPGRP